MLGYHFTGDKLRDGRPIPTIGERLEHEGQIELCVAGLHASEDPFDALQYAPGSRLHKVELEGDLVPHGNPADKHVGRRRRILASIDATELLRGFSRWCALQVIHLWDAPKVVREYLETGDESKRAAAWDAARAAAEKVAAEKAYAASAAAWAAAEKAVYAASAARDASAAAGAAQRQEFRRRVNEAFTAGEPY